MKLSNIFKNIAQADKTSFDEVSERRELLMKVGKYVTAAAVPFAAVTSSKKASAKTTDIISETITFIMSIDFLAKELYTQGLATAGLIPAKDVPAIQKILAAKTSHLNLWTAHLTSLSAPIPSPAAAYDLTGKGDMFKVLTEYKSFLTVAYAVEDVSVRMYNKAMVDLITGTGIRGTVTAMHTANARFAAHIRLLARNNAVDIMPWIAGNKAGSIAGAVSRAYQGEDNIYSINNISAVDINGFELPFDVATAAFDEPIADTEATAFIAGFTA